MLTPESAIFLIFFSENVGTDCFGSTAVNKFKFYQLFEIYKRGP